MRGVTWFLLAVLVAAGACADDDGGGGPPTTPAPPALEGDDTPLTDLADAAFDLGTPVFDDGGIIPVRFTCDGDGTSPPLAWDEVPLEAVTLELIVEDPDAPSGSFLHWRVEGIDPGSGGVAAGEVPPGGTVLENDHGETAWLPPCPPADEAPHRYLFRLTARGAAGDEVGRAELVGRFGR